MDELKNKSNEYQAGFWSGRVDALHKMSINDPVEFDDSTMPIEWHNGYRDGYESITGSKKQMYEK